MSIKELFTAIFINIVAVMCILAFLSAINKYANYQDQIHLQNNYIKNCHEFKGTVYKDFNGNLYCVDYIKKQVLK